MNMPGINGGDVCRELRNSPKTQFIPILILTGSNGSDLVVKAFACGADDFITKPFVIEELLARIESKIRRADQLSSQASHQVVFGDLVLDFQERSAVIGLRKVELGQIEFKILNYLIKNQGQLVQRGRLSEVIWGKKTSSERALDPHITNIRQKLRNSRCELKTIYSQGYSLVLKAA